jgi:hypothetical protein
VCATRHYEATCGTHLWLWRRRETTQSCRLNNDARERRGESGVRSTASRESAKSRRALWHDGVNFVADSTLRELRDETRATREAALWVEPTPNADQ